MIDFRRGRKREDPEINLIPFIDVLLVVLIFLMVTTTYSKFTELQITLPKADAEKAVEKPFEINVTVDAKGNYTVNNVPVAFHGVASLADDARWVVTGQYSWSRTFSGKDAILNDLHGYVRSRLAERTRTASAPRSGPTSRRRTACPRGGPP